MDWGSALGGIVDKYTGAASPGAPPAEAHRDFMQVAQNAPQGALAAAVEHAFRSDQTPGFPQMVAQLFSQADHGQRAGLLNRLLGAVGPGGLSAVPGLSNLGSMSGGAQQVTPQQAGQVAPADVEKLAAHAESRTPGIVGEISDFASQHPDIMKALGGAAITLAIQHLAHHPR